VRVFRGDVRGIPRHCSTWGGQSCRGRRGPGRVPPHGCCTTRRCRHEARRGFGYIRKLPSGRIQVSYAGPDPVRHAAPFTFATRLDAEAWLPTKDASLHPARARALHVRRAAYRVPGNQVAIGKPKSDAGIREAAIPPHLVPEIKRHLAEHAQFGRDGLLFPGSGGGHLYRPALTGISTGHERRPVDLICVGHDLRHTGATLAATTGASLAELMARLGHSTISASLRYQHAARDCDQVIAEALSKTAEGV
jgi:hypothetical protein